MNSANALHTVSGQAWDGVDYFCTTRQGGVSQGPWAALNLGAHTEDDQDHVASNRRVLRAMLPGEPVWLNQVHGIDVWDADRPHAQADSPRADAAVTTTPGRVLAIMTADCLPAVLASTDGRALGLAHAGWRGLAAGVLEATLGMLRQRAPGAAWRAWIGPAISQKHFEVGHDVYSAFVGQDETSARFFAPQGKQGKWLADLPGLASHRLRRAGVAQVELSGECSYAQAEKYYSYRRSARTGRMATVAWLR